MRFSRYIGIDYSGAATPESRSATLQLYESSSGQAPKRVSPSQTAPSRSKNWSRVGLFDWLSNTLSSNEPVIIGIDHGLSVPDSYFARYSIHSWEEFLVDFVAHWPTDQKGSTVEGLRAGNLRTGSSDELRLTERWTAGAKSVFQFDVQGSVAKSSHAGIPFVLRLKREHPKLHCWPFDGWSPAAGRSVIAEMFPSLFRNRFPRDDRTVDQQDAYSLCRWLADSDAADHLDSFLTPPLSTDQKAIAEREGWILGVY